MMVHAAVPLASILLWAAYCIPVVGAVPCSPQSDSWIITDEDEALSLASAVGCSDGNFTVTWVGAIVVSQTLTIGTGTSLTITGESEGSSLDGAGTMGPLIFMEGTSSTLTLRNVTMTGGSAWAGGAIHVLTEAAANIVDCTFSYNNASSSGGAIYAETNVNLSISGNTIFYRNTAASSGGAITAKASSSVSLTGTTTFIGNVAGVHGGAIFISEKVNMDIRGTSKFFSNAARYGGSIHGEDFSQVMVLGLANFTGNMADSQGGALHIAEDASLDVNGQLVMFVNNTAGMYGGAISMVSLGGSAVLSIKGITEFMKNSAGTDGGAVYVDTAKSVFVIGARILEGNSAGGGFGGGLYVASVIRMVVTNSSFASNSAAFGGAVATFSTGVPSDPIVYSSCTFTQNSAEEDGGAIYSIASYDDMRNVVMDGNFAVCVYPTRLNPPGNLLLIPSYDEGGSGGALVHAGEMSAMIDVTFSNNLAGGNGPAVLSLGAIVEMTNCTFTGNSFFCEPGTYLEDVEEGCRLNVVCLRCFGECITSVATVENGQRLPSCTATPEHTTTLEAGGTLASLELEKGFYRVSSESLSILECFNKKACVGGSIAGQYCAEGYTGPYCAVCMKDYASGYSYSCKACWKASSQAINAVIIIGLAVFILLLIVVVQYLIARVPPAAGDSGHEFPAVQLTQSNFWVRSATKHLVGTIKIVLVVWQISTQFTSITGTAYPGVYQDFIEGIGVLDLDRGLILSSSCLMESNFYDRLVLSACFPFAVVFVLVITRFIALKRNNRSPRVVAEIDNKHLSTLLVIVLLIYSTTSTTVFETFSCDSLDDGLDYLRADYRLECNTWEHRIYKAFAAVMIVVYPIGIPLCLGWWLFLKRHALRGQSGTEGASEHLAPFAELWEPYKPERYYWEIIEFIRRVLLTGISVFIYPNSAAQISIIFLLAAFFGVVFEVLDPYRDSRDTWLYRTGYVVVLLSFYLALLIQVEVSNDRSASQDMFSIVLVVVHCILILSVVTEGLALISDACRKMREI